MSVVKINRLRGGVVHRGLLRDHDGTSRQNPYQSTLAEPQLAPAWSMAGHWAQARQRVRFTPRADIDIVRYSITLSARASKDDGTSKPSPFAVFKLITSSYLVGACT